MMQYLISLVISLIIYIVVFILIKMGFLKSKKFHFVFCGLIIVTYLYIVLNRLIECGPANWNFLNTLPTANVSPFMFAVTSICFIFPKSIRKYLFALISCLSFGMFMAGSLELIVQIARRYPFYFVYSVDALAHLTLSLYGIYLTEIEEVKLKSFTTLIGSLSIVATALVMLVINLFTGYAFFGLGFKGNHNIYNMVLTSSPILSCLIYFGGLMSVLAVGWGIQVLINRKQLIKKTSVEAVNNESEDNM